MLDAVESSAKENFAPKVISTENIEKKEERIKLILFPSY